MPPLRKPGTLILFVALLLAPIGSSAEVRVDAFLEDAESTYLGQPIRLVVLVETDTWFTSAPRYPEIQIPGAIVLQPDAFGVNATRREGGTTWTGQRQRYLIFPQRPGELTVPPFEIGVEVSVDGKAGPLQQLTTPAVTTRVVLPPGAERVEAFVTMRDYRLTEAWDGDPAAVVVGDALVRTITQTASDTFALLLPALEFDAPDSVAVYPAMPTLDDRSNRGTYSATRTDSITYVLQRSGTWTLPATEVHWFDLASSRMKTEVLEELVIDVGENPAAVSGENLASEDAGPDMQPLTRIVAWLRDNMIGLTIGVAAMWLGAQLWRRFRKPLVVWWRQRRQQRQEGEAAYFSHVIKAIKRRNPDRFVAALWAWRDRLPHHQQAPLTLPVPESELQLWETFRRQRYGGASQADLPSEASGSVRRLRRHWLTDRKPTATDGALNP